MPRGRPSKYDPKYCDEMIEFMAKGYTYTSFAGHIRVSRETLDAWAREHDEFSDAKRIAQAAAEKEINTMGLLLARGKIQGNSAAWWGLAKNVAKWSDRADLKITGDFQEKQKDHDLLRSVDRSELIKLVKKKVG